ncbi:thioredoxin reductase-like selenoprotein T homolog CG3887 [Phlebotomus papatasi]|nr:thioredoxin reductase-like selenoprotein T homolog CG3887 [Phlebotomus papatasi]
MNSVFRKNFTLIAAVICLVAIIHVFPVEGNSEKSIPISKFSQNVGPTMTILYCYSCGYRKAFDDYVSILNDKYPEILVRGANYDPPGFNMHLSRIVLLTKLILIVVIVSSFDIFGFLGQPIPGWWRWCIENKIYACMMIFFVGNMLEAQLISSGAFEIALNDVPVWSKLQTGRIPAPQELFQIIESHLQFNDKLGQNPNYVK